MKNIIKDWLKFADDDIKAANSILKDDEYGVGILIQVLLFFIVNKQ